MSGSQIQKYTGDN